MKKTLLICSFIVLAISLFAQKGMFDISFDQDVKEVHKALLAKGFTEGEKTSSFTQYSNPKIPMLQLLTVRDSEEDGTVSGWTIKYIVNGDQALIDKYMADLTALHKVEPYYDDYYEEDVWELENYNAIYAYTLEDGKIMVIEYTYFDDWEYWY
jgi:hypothetical protein